VEQLDGGASIVTVMAAPWWARLVGSSLRVVTWAPSTVWSVPRPDWVSSSSTGGDFNISFSRFAGRCIALIQCTLALILPDGPSSQAGVRNVAPTGSAQAWLARRRYADRLFNPTTGAYRQGGPVRRDPKAQFPFLSG